MLPGLVCNPGMRKDIKLRHLAPRKDTKCARKRARVSSIYIFRARALAIVLRCLELWRTGCLVRQRERVLTLSCYLPVGDTPQACLPCKSLRLLRSPPGFKSSVRLYVKTCETVEVGVRRLSQPAVVLVATAQSAVSLNVLF